MKRIRTENGTLVPASFQSDWFARWQKSSNVVIPKVGEMELDGSASMGRAGVSRFRHNSVTAPKADSKNFLRKKDAQETKWRKEGLTGDKLKEAKSEWLESKGVTNSKKMTGKSELK